MARICSRDADAVRWPDFREAALQRGFHSLQATPLRLRGEVIGAMNLLDTKDVAVAQALADVATIGILAERAAQQRELVAAQLQHALDSRIVIEQAKGVVAQTTGLTMDGAFNALRAYSRSSNTSLRIVAAAVVDRTLDVARIVGTRSSTSRRGPR